MRELMLQAIPYAIFSIGIILFGVILLVELNDIRLIHRTAGPKKQASRQHLTLIVDCVGSPEDIGIFCLNVMQAGLKSYDIVLVRKSTKIKKKELLIVAKGTTKDVTIYTPRTKKTPFGVLRAAYAKSQKGAVVLASSSDVLLNQDALRRVSQNGSISEKILYTLPVIEDVPGVAGVVIALQESLKRIRFRIKELLSHTQIRIETPYVMQASVLRKTENYVIRTGTLPVSTRLNGGAVIQIPLSPLWLMSIVIIFILSTFLTVAAINGYGRESFGLSWIGCMIVGFSIILLDTQASWKNRFKTVACIGFMPLLLAAMPFLKSHK
jgi:hypothetical protein